MVKRRRRSKKWFSWLIILVLLVAAGVVCYLVWDNYFNDDRGNEDVVVVEQDEQEEIKKEVSMDNDGGEVDVTQDEKKVKQYEGEDPNAVSELSGVVTYAGVVDGKLMIRINIDQFLESGSCELILLRDGATIYNSIASIIGNVSTATCEGFDVPTSQLGGGRINININLKANDKTGVIRGEVNI